MQTSHENPHHASAQPAARPGMTLNQELSGLAKTAGTSYAKEVGKEAGRETMKYESDNGQAQLSDAQQQLDDAKVQAQGMWTKYCGCFSGA